MGQIWGTVVDRTSLFRSQLENRRLNEGTLQIMESVLISKDVKSLLEIRSCLSEFLRSELVSILQEVEEKTVEQKLSVLEFFVRAFFLAGDVESCLMLRYEALILRERYSATHHWLHVSYEEWLAFIEHSLDNGFYSVAVKACEHASLCLQPEDIVDPKSHIFFADLQAINQLKKLKDVALALVPSNSNLVPSNFGLLEGGLLLFLLVYELECDPLEQSNQKLKLLGGEVQLVYEVIHSPKLSRYAIIPKYSSLVASNGWAVHVAI